MFVQSLDFIVEESLILLFQPTICRVDNVPPPQSCPYARGFWIPSDARCLGSTQVHTPNGILIGSTTFAGLKIVTNRPTDRPRYCICNNRPHLHSSEMQPNNQLCNIVAEWHSGNIVGRINEVTLHRARSVLGWMTVFCRQITSVFHQATQANSTSYPQWDGNEYQPKCTDALRQGVKAGMVHSTYG